jgi:hypothetical protein
MQAGANASCHDSILIECGKHRIISHVLPSTGTAPITSASWLTLSQILLGSSIGECFIVTLSQSWYLAGRYATTKTHVDMF